MNLPCRALLLLAALGSCAGTPRSASMKDPTKTVAAYDRQILDLFTGPAFRELDCDALYGPGMAQRGVHCFVSTLKREELTARISRGVASFAEGAEWAENYGQFDRFYRLSHDPAYTFSFGVSRVAYKDLIYRDQPGVWGHFESDVLYSPIVRETK
jgi:hypothetical protein